MASHDDRYDSATKTMWLHRDYDDPYTLVPNEEAQAWSKRLRAGSTSDGKPLERVNYVFAHEDTAEYNSHALAFARLGTYVGSHDSNAPFGGEEPSFDAKDDFGM